MSKQIDTNQHFTLKHGCIRLKAASVSTRALVARGWFNEFRLDVTSHFLFSIMRLRYLGTY